MKFSDNPRQILVVGPSWIGDLVMTQSLFITLKQDHPQAEIDVLAPAWAPQLTARMPQIRDTWTDPGGLAWGRRRELARQMQGVGYDWALLLKRTIKSALIPWFAQIPRRTGVLGESRYGLVNDICTFKRQDLVRRVEEYVAIGVQPDTPMPPPTPYPELVADAENFGRLRKKLGLENSGKETPVFGLAPGAAFGTSKRWPPMHYAQLAKRLLSAGCEVWVFGSEGDSPTGELITQIAGTGTRNLCGKTGLADVVDLMSATTAVVGNDTGLTHMASACAPQVIALYGSTDPAYAPPLCEHGQSLSLDLSCSPCTQRECPLGHGNCLSQLTVEAVFAACERALEFRADNNS